MAKDSSTTYRTISDLAKAVDVTIKTAYSWVNNGVVEHSDFVGPRAVFTPEEFEEAKRVGLERKAAINILARRG